MRDVREGTAMHEGRRAFEGLYEIGLERIFQQRRHSAFCAEIMRRDRFIVVGVGHHDLAQTLLQIGDGSCKAENGHDLGCDRDIEAVFTRHACLRAAKTAHDVAQLTIVHVHHALPRDAAHVDAEFVALLNMVIEHSCEQVVRSADSMKIAREVQVDVFHGNDLGISATCSAALHAKDGPERWLAQRDHGILAHLGKCIVGLIAVTRMSLPGW